MRRYIFRVNKPKILSSSNLLLEAGYLMTICIGVICENRTKGVVASDRMITERLLSVEFEHGERKFELLSEKCIGLSAGEALPPTEIFRNAKANIPDASNIQGIAETVSKAFRDYKKKRIEALILRQRGLTVDDFLEKQRSLLPEIAIRLDQQISGFKMNLNILLVGVDQTGAHMFRIVDPGHSICFDRLGFHAIGSGLPHALATIIAYNYTPALSLKKSAYIVYEAKRNAEKAPGVGKELDLCVVDDNGVRDISNADIEILEKAYKERTAIAISRSEKIEEILNSLEW